MQTVTSVNMEAPISRPNCKQRCKSKIQNSVLPGVDKKIRSLGDAIERAQKEAEAAANATM